jgi:hypothetical protein
LLTSGAENSLISSKTGPNGWWQGSNGRWYPPTWEGTSLSGYKSALDSTLNGLKLAGQGLWGVGLALSGADFYDAYKSNNNFGMADAFMDSGWGTAATFGGWVGFAGGASYFATSMLIGIPAVYDVTVTPIVGGMCYLSSC